MANGRSRFHTPDAIPVCSCGVEAELHIPSHKPRGVWLGLCECGASSKRHRPKKHKPGRARVVYAGIDGEGLGNAPHRYCLLSVVDESGQRVWETSELAGLTTEDCLELILSIPSSVRLFAYAFTYDLTKILKDLPDETLYLLFRPGLRPGKRGPRAVKWKGYRLNIVGSKFSVHSGKRRKCVWDIFKFFQGPFVKALKDWEVPCDVAAIEDMKGQRALFTENDFERVKVYCRAECQALAVLAHRLNDAHTSIGIKLRQWHGPGSTASVLLKGRKRREIEPRMRHAVSCAFAGGRFENRARGPVQRPVYGKDISSAYPYQIALLPCLDHGAWRYTRDEADLEKTRAAVVHYLSYTERDDWAPFFHRGKDGTICYPRTTSGWAWLPEYAAAKVMPGNHVRFVEAYVYDADCDCIPFPWMPERYIQRYELGKDGRGIVVKLGYNSCYGKLAQSVGKPKFQDWIYAGMITSGTRAQILDAIRLDRDIIAIATDGIYSTGDVRFPDSIDLGTHGKCYDPKDRCDKPLGGWERKEYPNGMFFARPGIYFTLGDEGDANLIRARGVGRKSVYDNRKAIEHAYAQRQEAAILPPLRRFIGARTSIQIVRGKVKRYPSYGEWLPRPVKISFNPAPKRARDMAIRTDIKGESYPYSPIVVSPEAAELRKARLELIEQPDGDFAGAWEGPDV